MGNEIIEFDNFINNYTILDSELSSISVYVEDDVLHVALTMKLNNLKLVRLIFKDVIEYNFYYSNDNFFYNVSDYILLFTDNSYYISLDPYDGSLGPSEDDSDFIKSNKIFIEIL